MDEQSSQKQSAPGIAGSAGAQHAPDKDLSQEIERVLEREPMDLIKCVRVFGNYYRCNWWSRAANAGTQPDYAWAGIVVDFIRKSRFLSATMNAGELVINEIGPVSAPISSVQHQK
jgi:hypothetical protein